MKRLYWVLVAALVLVVTATAGAQMQPPPSGQPGPGDGPGMGAGMCPMMMGGSHGESARMMQMRGEMMKAMGDIMIKYGKAMESAK